MLASGLMAGFGFIFWAVVARNFADSEVGLAATLLSLSSLISLLSLAGFDSTFVRFLPKSDKRQDYINSGLIVASCLSVVLSIFFIISFIFFTPNLSFVADPFNAACFIIFNVFTTLNVLTNAVFLAYRQTLYVLIINLVFSVFKVGLPFLFITGGAMTIFNIAGLAQVVGVLLSCAIIWKKFGHTFQLKVSSAVLKLSRKYAFSVYCSSMLNLLPPTILPLIVTHQIGAAASAYFFMAFTIASLLYTIAYSTMQSVFAEGSHKEEALREHTKRGVKITGILLIPAAILVIILAPYGLMIFGESYATNGTDLLRLFAVSALFVSLYTAFNTILKVLQKVKALVFINIVYSTTVIGIAAMYSEQYGLMAIGYAWLIGNIAAAIVGFMFLAPRLKERH